MNKIDVHIVSGTKTYKSSKEIITDVLRGNPIHEGDVGAFLVGVFACQPLTADGRGYDFDRSGQWKHCLFKKQWKGAIHGNDEFTEEQKALIMTGFDLAMGHHHGWGEKAISQKHVVDLIKKWKTLS